MSQESTDRTTELLEKLLMVQLYSMGLPQGEIAKMLGKSKTDINAFLKPLANREKK